MYYFFLRGKKLEKFKTEYERCLNSLETGKTPVFSELRNARTTLLELFPFSTIQGIFLVLGTFLIAKIQINELLKVAIVLLVNNMCMVLANCIYTFVKHGLRVLFLKRIGYPPTERNISVLESLEYQSV